MAVMASITINDGATTPVAHTFNPVSDSPPEWADTDTAKLYKHLQNRLTVSSKRVLNANGVNRVKLALSLPTGGDGVTVPSNEVSRYSNVVVDFYLPAKGTKQERKDLRTLLLNALQNAQIIDVVDELNSAW